MSDLMFKVGDCYHDNGAKVVDVVASFEGAEGQTEERHTFQWAESERYKDTGNGKLVEKDGSDYKREIGEALEAIYNPKVPSPFQ